MSLDMERLLDVFRAEAADNLATLERTLLDLEARRGGLEAAHEALRAAHTLKGNSAMLGFDAVTDAAHALEDELQGIRDAGAMPDARAFTRLLESVDALAGLVAAALAKPRAPARVAAGGPAGRNPTMRVEVARLDTLLDLTGEITIARGRLGQLVAHERSDGPLAASLWHLEQLHGALQDEVMKLRMVSLGPVFRSHHRTVRDTALKLGKDVRLVIEGDDVEVDTSIAEQVRDPLTHMVRNAIDHGIETPAERRAAGKSAQGTVTLRARHLAGSVEIVLADDGRGLDRAAITGRAEALGLAANAAGLSDEAVWAFIFEPGFSTAREVTAVSGRGVGMDVVRRHIEALRGTVEIASTPGAGTRFTIRLPLTVAIIGGFVVGVGPERFVLPLEAVEECLDFGSAAGGDGAGEGVLNLRGTALPYVRLRDVLRLPAEPSRPAVVVVRAGERRVGLVVDSLQGDCQAVIKPLRGALRRLPAISGSTILGDGRVALILNVPQLVDLAVAQGSAPPAAAA